MFVTPLVLAAASLSLPGNDSYFVDAVNGSDANSGLSADDPVRTISRALALSDGAAGSVTIAEGDYNQALGETFPLIFDQVPFVYAAPGAVIDAGGAAVAIQADSEEQSLGQQFSGLTVRNAGTGLQIELTRQGVFSIASVQHCHFEDCGLALDLTTDPLVNSSTSFQIQQSSFEGGQIGIQAGAKVRLIASRIAIEGASTAGVRMGGDSSLNLQNASLTHCGIGLDVAADESESRYGVTSTVIADCQVAIHMSRTSGVTPCVLGSRLTIANNGAAFSSDIPWPGPLGAGCLTITRSILSGNSEAYRGFALLRVGDSVGEALQFPGNGNIDLDPEFRDAAAGDYGLKRGSRAVDAFPAGLSIRNIDGDLDGIPRSDYGALELATMVQAEPVQPGDDARLLVRGDAPGLGLALFSPQLAGQGRFLPFGSLHLTGTGTRRLYVFPLDSNGEGEWTLPMDLGSASLGNGGVVQALIPSPDAPLGRALTNAIVIERARP